MNEKPVSFRLYRITGPEGKSIKNDLFEPVLKIDRLEDRHVILDGERITLWEFIRENNWVFGQMYRCQSDAYDEFLSGQSGRTRPIPLDPADKEGITEKTHFLYVPDCDILVLQGGKKRVGPSMMIKYFSRLSGLRQIDIRATMTANQFDKFKKMNEINYITVSLEKPDKGTAYSDSNDFPGKVVEELSNIGAYHITLKLSRSQTVSRQNKSGMFLAEARKLIDRFVKMSEDDTIHLKTLNVKGSPTIDDDLDEVDLIRDRMKYTRNVSFDENGPSSFDCYMGCREAYNHFESDILTLYRNRN